MPSTTIVVFAFVDDRERLERGALGAAGPLAAAKAGAFATASAAACTLMSNDANFFLPAFGALFPMLLNPEPQTPIFFLKASTPATAWRWRS